MSKYDITVVITTNNSENTIRKCINSIVIQTYDFSKIQVVIADSGSLDLTASICDNYVYAYSNVEYYTEIGYAEAQNKGMEIAQGDYVVFLSADRYLSKNAIEAILSFWEEVRDEVDVVFCHETGMLNGKSTKEHARYQCLKETGIYDLSEIWYLLPRKTSFCTKKNIDFKFCEEEDFYGEQKNILRLLSGKEKIGYLKEAKFCYSAGDKRGDKHLSFSLRTYDESINYFEKIFNDYVGRNEKVPFYVQAIFFYDCVWRLREGKLWPHHYEECELRAIKDRTIRLLQMVHNNVILNFPELDSYEKVYWIRLKDSKKITYSANDEQVCLYADGMLIHERQTVEIVLVKILVQHGIIKVRGYLKSPLFVFCNTEMSVDVNGEEKKIALIDSGAGYYKAREKTNTFWGFEFLVKHEERTEIDFNVYIDSVKVNTIFYNMPSVSFEGACKRYISRNVLAEQKCSRLLFKTLTVDELNKYQQEDIEKEKNEVIRKCKSAIYAEDIGEVWIYADSPNVKISNAFFQFMNDKDKNDGIRRFYVVGEKWIDKITSFADCDKEHLVARDSLTYVELYMRADKILTSDINGKYYPTYKTIEKKRLQKMLRAEIIYLQHSVVFVHMPWIYSKYKGVIDKVVVSIEFEKENFCHIYDYDEKDIICSGMARYDFLETKQGKKGKVLFAPLWRNYFAQKTAKCEAVQSDLQQWLELDYFRENIQFLNSAKLQDYLKQNDLILEYSIHPKLRHVYEIEKMQSDYIREIPEDIDLNDYNFLITDYSSFMFDFLYMDKPVYSIIPDRNEVISGLNGFSQFDVNLKDICNFSSSKYDDFMDFISKPCLGDKARNIVFFNQNKNNKESLYYHLMKVVQEEV